jgi:hypothetical protein
VDINEERIAFYFEVGLATTQWASVEMALSAVVVELFKPEDAVSAVVGFRAIENFRSKLEYVDALIRVKVRDSTRLSEWDSLSDRCQQAAKKRNRVAHNWVLNSPSEERAGRRIMLLPLRPAKNSDSPHGAKYPGAIYLRDIASYRLEFAALMAAIENFVDRLGGRPERFPKAQEQPPNPPKIHELRRQIYMFAKRPPRSPRAQRQ